MSIITESQLGKMSVRERFQLRRECAENRDIESLLTIVKFLFIRGAAATNESNLPEMCYYYGRLHRAEELQEFLKENDSNLFMLPKSSKELAQNLLNIGVKFPHLNESEIQYLEDKYCDSKTFELFDIIMFDCNRLPRPIKKFNKESLNSENKDFSREFLLQVYAYFSANEELDGNYDKLYVYSRIENKIIRKEYAHLALGEYCIEQPIYSNEFWGLMQEHYGKQHADSFFRQLFDDQHLEKSKTSNSYLLYAENIEEVAENYFKDSLKVNDVKAHIALFWLKKINSQKINLI